MKTNFGAIVVLVVVSCAASAQQPSQADLRHAGFLQLGQARVAATSASLIFRDDVLDEIAVVAFEAGDRVFAADTLKQALAASHEQLTGGRDSGPGQMSSQAIAGFNAGIAAQRHLAVHDLSGARAWLKAALEAFPVIGDERERMVVRMRILKVQIALGDLNGARRIAADEYASDHPDATALGEIAAQMARNGDVAGAKTMANSQPDYAAAQILENVSIAQAESKDFDGALQTVMEIHDPYGRINSLAAIAEEERKAGDNAGALATFATALKLNPAGSDPPHSVVVAEARSGLFQNALQLLSSMSESESSPKSNYYLDVGVIAAAAKRPDVAKKCFAAAFSSIQKEAKSADFPNGEEMDQKEIQLELVVRAEAQAGDFADAIETAGLLSGRQKQFALAAIASAQSQAGDIHGAEETLAKDPVHQSRLPAVMEAKARAGDFLSAFNGARPYGGHELEKIFAAYCRPERMSTCVSAAAELSFPERRAGALLGIAESLLGISPPPIPGSSSAFEYSVPPR